MTSPLTLLRGGRSSSEMVPREPKHHLAFVLLETSALPRGEAVVGALQDIAPRVEAAMTAEGVAKDDVLQFSIGNGASLLVSLMPLPVPNREADGAFAYSYSAGLNAERGLAPHQAHLITFFRDEPGRTIYDGLTRFTYLVAAVAQASHAIAIYWGDAGATHSARFFIDRARECDPDLMLPLWCGFEVAQDGPRASVLTVGMRRQLGIMEMRITAPRRNLSEYVGAMFDILAYAARSGAAVPDGDTIGRSADERLRVRYERSPADPEQQVWRVDFE